MRYSSYLTGILCALAFSIGAQAQQFFNLTADEVKIDSVLPEFCYARPLGSNYADSVYSVKILYPEFIEMSTADIERYRQLAPQRPGRLPEIRQTVSVDRKEGHLMVSFTPVVYRGGKYQKLVSFMLKVSASAASRKSARRGADTGERYAANSVLNTGSWAKIRVPATGVYQLTSELIRRAGFSNLDKVKVYGYGGARQPDVLTGSYITETDDLHEVPTCMVNGRRLFYAVGPVSWSAQHARVRNPYSNYGYYLITESDDEPLTITADELRASCYPKMDDYCSLYEVDDFAWYTGGSNLYDSKILTAGKTHTYTISATGASEKGSLTVVLSGATGVDGASVAVTLNGEPLGNITYGKTDQYTEMNVGSKTFNVTNLQATNEVTLTPNANAGTVRLDYISTYSSQPRDFVSLESVTAVPEYDCNITNQNHHADPQADMVIIIPTSQKFRTQAERLKTLHEVSEGLKVNIVPADELYNEFASGTPDANAYRRYMKMLYDRATSSDTQPRYLLLFGDCIWDNRLLTSASHNIDANDMLLCYESDNSYSHTHCYITDDYFCYLDDGEGGSIVTADLSDVAVGRITAQTLEEATTAVDKIYSYVNNENAGAWQNLICVMGDDGNGNQHMSDADAVARMVEDQYSSLQVKRIMWDAYPRVSSSTGNSYPDVTKLIKQQMQQGALMMNYSGHGRADAVSHEYVLTLGDFSTATSLRLPLWMTASCDIMPFDGIVENIGETALFNKKGGAVAFYGTTRTVYQNYNRQMNLAFTKYVLSTDSKGLPRAIGEAARLAKNELITKGTDKTTNKLQYSLLGDPALRLAIPKRQIEIETINDINIKSGAAVTIPAGSTATMTGRVLQDDGATTDESFDGTVTALVRDVVEEIVCRLNDTSSEGASSAFVYKDRTNTIYNGTNTVSQGRFTITFAVPKDIKYSDQTALINVYAINNTKSVNANGICGNLTLNGTASDASSTQGPDMYCYLNSPTFTNGGNVNTTPYFIAELNDENGINAAGSGIGHDLQLIIDGNMTTTYTLNDYFQYDFGSYTSGKVGFSIPELSYGQHKLQFRAWDVLNNSSTTELTFNVVKGLEPKFVDVECTPNPARTTTSFRVIHDRIGSNIDVKVDIFDTSGRHLWTYNESGVSSSGTYSIDWDLVVDGGRRLDTGLYLYRVSISSEGSTYASKAKKLIVITHQ